MTRMLLVLPCVLLAVSCSPGPEGLRATPDGAGPKVVFDLLAKPLAEIPQPNNVATRLDPTSPTGRRVNVSLESSTKAETKVRRKANDLDGFGIFSPITVKFDAPLDPANIRDRQAKNHDFADDAVLLVNVDRNSPDFGKATPLDAGQGNYPIGIEWPWQYWDWDEHKDSVDLLFETHDEDLNGNGVLDPYEDVDFDGVLDKPNTWSGKDPGPAGIGDLITFYEKQTNTLVLWPVAPLRERTTYAVVLTKYLVGADGNAVRSPFPYVNAADQTPDLAPLAEVLPKLGFTTDDVTFAWSFTTQSITADLENIRKGMYGFGELASLASEYPPDLKPKMARDPEDDGTMPLKPYFLPGEMAIPLINALGPVLTYKPSVVAARAGDSGFVD